MGGKKQKNRSKKICGKRTRLALYLSGLLLLAGGIISFFAHSQPTEETIENTTYSYKLTVDSAYRVRVLPNELFTDEWLSEGGMYSEKLTDYVEIMLSAELVGSGKAELGGNYQITAVIEGYQSGADSKKIIYRKEFELEQGNIAQTAENQARAQETIEVKPLTYRQHVEKAEQILGNSTSKDIYLLFEGTFQIDAETGAEEKGFSYRLPIPLGASSSFYEIPKPNAVTEEGKMTELVSVVRQPDKVGQILAAGVAVIGLAMELFVLLATRLPEKEEKWQMEMSKIMRKYGSRMVRLETLPDLAQREQLFLKDMDSMIILAEELRQPVLYSLDQEHMPSAGLFYIPDGKRIYVFQRLKPSITLVVDDSDKSGNIS